MQPLCVSDECCPGGRGNRGGRGGCSRGRGNSRKRGARGGNGGWDDQGFSQSSANFGDSYHQHPEGSDQGYYPQFGTPNYDGGARGGYAGSGQDYSGASRYEDNSSAGFAGYGHSPNPGAVNEPYCHGCDYSGYNGVGRGGVCSGYVGYPLHHGAARRGQGYNGMFGVSRNGGFGHQDSNGARSGNAGVRGQRGAGRRRRGVGGRGYARGGRGYRGGRSNSGRSVSSHRSDTTDVGENNAVQKNGRSKQRPVSNSRNDGGEKKNNIKDANDREKIHNKPKKLGDEKDRSSKKPNSSNSDSKGKDRRKSRYEGDSNSSRSSGSKSSSPASSTASSDSSSRSSSSDRSDSSDGSSTSTASSKSSSASSNYGIKTESTNRSKRYSRERESSNIHEKSCRCKKCKERRADNTDKKSKWSKEKSHDADKSFKTSSRKREGGSTNRLRRSKDEYDSSAQESEDDSKHTSGRKYKERSSNKSRDYVGDRTNRSKSDKGAATNSNKSRDEPSKRDSSSFKTSSSAFSNLKKKNQSSVETSSNTTTPSLVSLAPRNTQNAGTIASSTTTPRLVPLTPRNTQNASTTSSSTTTPRLVPLTPRNTQNASTTSSSTTTLRLVPLTPRNSQNAGTTPSPVTQYEWQFQDNKGYWIAYGQSNTRKGSGSSTSASSDDIEKHYNNDTAKSPVQIQSNSYHYVLDFQTMTQTNAETSVQRPIRRILKQAVKPVVLPNISTASSDAGTTSSTASVYYEWQFEDVKGSWIRYGSPNTGGDLSCVTTTSSDDIEKHFSSDPDKTPLLIQSNSHQYILDFQKMSQTNQNTFVQRQIRRVLSAAAKPTVKPKPINIQYEWQFQDEHGAWVRYGSPNTDGDLSCVTSTSSDDIEKHYSSDPMKTALLIQSNSHQYLLDFQKMSQTNQVTAVLRSIRRVATQPGKRIVTKSPQLKYFGVGASNCHYEWQFEDEHGGWIRYGSPNSGGDLSCVTKITSDDIEKHYSTSPNSSLTTQSNSYRYLLDLQSMTQTNQTTMTRRRIRRVLTQLTQSSRTQQVSSRLRRYFDSQSAAINRLQSTVAYEWFFLDENKSWIPYGQPNSLNKTDCVTSVSSDDIEKHYQQNPHQSIDIASQKHMYRLDFVNMTQTNKQTLVVRSISRKPSTQQGFNARGRRSDLNSHSSSNSDSLSSNWASMAHSSAAWTAVLLSTNDHEYIKHIGIIKQSVPTFKVRQMYRIQNPFLWKAYVNKKDYMEKQNPGIRFREEYLYHGTDPKNVKAICEENIDWRLHGTSHGQSQGRGAYFAKSPQLATSYSGQQGVVFIVKVLVGHTTTGSSSIVKPSKDRSGKPYDTTVDNETNPSIFVKYDTQEYYPEYYVEF